MTGQQKLWVALAACHLTLVAYSTLPLPLPTNLVGDGLRWYGSMSGANNSYGFFKQVGCCFRVSFILTDGVKEPWIDQLNRGEFGQETELRFNSGVNLISDYDKHLLQHWSATMLARHPTAIQVYPKLERYDPGTMEDYRAGHRPQWEVVPFPYGFDREGRTVPKPENEP